VIGTCGQKFECAVDVVMVENSRNVVRPVARIKLFKPTRVVRVKTHLWQHIRKIRKITTLSQSCVKTCDMARETGGGGGGDSSPDESYCRRKFVGYSK
jgi:hypothetical protein